LGVTRRKLSHRRVRHVDPTGLQYDVVDTARRELVAGRDAGLAGTDDDRLHACQGPCPVASDPVQDVDLAFAVIV
jgi:hypothetical protein